MRKLILVLNILVMMVCAVWGQVVWDGNEKEDLEYIDGVYHISTAAQLAKLADLVIMVRTILKARRLYCKIILFLMRKCWMKMGICKTMEPGLIFGRR